MLKPFKEFISLHNLVDTGDRILLAVSGGLDSMVMLDLFRKAGFKIAVAHCNFGLRGKASDEDQTFVSHFCSSSGISFFTQRFETKNYAEEKGLSIQMAARDLRYQWFDNVMDQEKFHWLATAHHLNDNIETVLMRWVKGSNLDQLTGIPVKNEKVIRPLLFAKREDILAYAKKEKIQWREDISNESDDYQRNFIRHQVIDKLKEINPSLEETFSSSLDKIKGAHEIMQRGLGQLKDSMTRMEGDKLYIDKNLLMLLQHPAFVIYEWLRPYGFEWDRCVQLVEATQSGKQFFSSTHQAVVDREFIIVSPQKERLTEILIEEGQDKAALGPWMLAIKAHKGSKIETKKTHGTFDLGSIKFPVVWRKWRTGDSFFPLGLGHKKKVSDFLIDEKISMLEKNDATVIESGGEIVWVVGLRVDDRFKVTAQTKSILEIKLTQI
ncbi:MAG: tRNA lysidine(34) synthetase TilS [Cyclobacteriaceae bacterium]|nr:tRNA lysidine(34) synthetase TilS [Cyclobacteriaceae bacterium]